MNNSHRKIVVILGPTAVGKSKLAFQLAKTFSGQIISADSMQVYQGMEIGTDKPTLAMRQVVPHHLVDIVSPTEPFTVAQFLTLATEAIQKIHQCGDIPFVVGGTGLYLKAFLEGFAIPKLKENPELRETLNRESTDTLYTRLTQIDPQRAATIHPHDKKRLIRALELYDGLKERPSLLRKKKKTFPENQLIKIGLTCPRDLLYQAIDKRVDHMVEAGLFHEVEALLKTVDPEKSTAFQAIGYKESLDYLRGEKSQAETILLIKQRSRNFAKRQMTWFRRILHLTWFDSRKALLVDEVTQFLRKILQ